MTEAISNTFRVAKPAVSWAGAQGLMIGIGSCLLLAILSYLVIANLSLDPIEIAGETMWFYP